jgi:hypothetical protein
MVQITINLNLEEEKALRKRAKKNLMTLEEQVQDIIRRSCVNSGKSSSVQDSGVDDRLVSIFSRKKR